MQLDNFLIKEDCIKLIGDLTFDTVKSIYDESLQNFPTTKVVRVDFTEASTIDSAGLALIMHLFTFAQKNNQQLKLVSAPQTLSQLARVSGVDSFLNSTFYD